MKKTKAVLNQGATKKTKVVLDRGRNVKNSYAGSGCGNCESNTDASC